MNVATRRLLEEQIAVVIVLESGKRTMPCGMCHTVFFRTAFPCSGGYHLERGVIPLHDVVGINCEKATPTENQCAELSSIWVQGCMLIIVRVLSDLSSLPLLGRGRKSWFINININIY